MGQWAYFREISPRLLGRLVDEPRLILGVLALRPRDVTTPLKDLPNEMRAHAEKALTAFDELKSFFPDELERERWGTVLLQSEGFGPVDTPSEIDIEKRWHRLSEILDLKPGPDDQRLGFAIVGGSEIGEDLGYGPARFFTPGEVSDISKELGRLTEASILSRLETNEQSRELEYVWSTLQTVSAYYSSAASKEFGMLLFFG